MGCSFPAQAADTSPVSPHGAEFIAKWEVGSPAYYQRCCFRPMWPGNSASGVTIGIGYDLGHQSDSTILRDWRDHPHKITLAAMAGYKGTAARNLARRNPHATVDYGYAMRVFRDPTLIRYYNIARRSFPGMERMSQHTQDALVSLVYNRGGNMLGTARREMRHIRDVCIPDLDEGCVATQLRVMVRLWRGTVVEKGLTKRRYEEALLAEGKL